jgi:hypothetical protein
MDASLANKNSKLKLRQKTTCSKCNAKKRLCPDGNYRCVNCKKKSRIGYTAKNRARINAKHRLWWFCNPERVKATARKYRLAHLAESNARLRAWRKRQKENRP